MQMTPGDRAVIAERLISSLETLTDPNVEAAWQEEIQRRVTEVKSGHVVCIPWEDVRERLRDSTSASC